MKIIKIVVFALLGLGFGLNAGLNDQLKNDPTIKFLNNAKNEVWFGFKTIGSDLIKNNNFSVFLASSCLLLYQLGGIFGGQYRGGFVIANKKYYEKMGKNLIKEYAEGENFLAAFAGAFFAGIKYLPLGDKYLSNYFGHSVLVAWLLNKMVNYNSHSIIQKSVDDYVNSYDNVSVDDQEKYVPELKNKYISNEIKGHIRSKKYADTVQKPYDDEINKRLKSLGLIFGFLVTGREIYKRLK